MEDIVQMKDWLSHAFSWLEDLATTNDSDITAAKQMHNCVKENMTAAVSADCTYTMDTHPTIPKMPDRNKYDAFLDPHMGYESDRNPNTGFIVHDNVLKAIIEVTSPGCKCNSFFKKKCNGSDHRSDNPFKNIKNASSKYNTCFSSCWR
jgi:hypothetical protein